MATKMATKTTKVVVGEGGHGAGDAGAVPAPATTPETNTLPDDGETGAAHDDASAPGVAPISSGEQGADPITAAVNEAFALHPMDRLYVTADGQVFGNEKHAHNHARSLPVRLVETVDRNTWGK